MTDAMFRVLVIEDDRDIREVLRTLLETQQYRVVLAESAERGRVEARNHKPDVVLVDLGLPDHDGHALIRHIRTFSALPIIVLSARTLEEEKVRALDEGADDYVTKPFDAGELLARIRAALRRATTASKPQPTLKIGETRINLATREVEGPAGPMHLTPVEFRLLACLARGRGLMVSQDTILREVWGPDRITDTRGLRAYVKNLRHKIEPNPGRPQYLVTEPGVGYRLLETE
jgi:two-component system KDP operon response regulator KdpE